MSDELLTQIATYVVVGMPVIWLATKLPWLSWLSAARTVVNDDSDSERMVDDFERAVDAIELARKYDLPDLAQGLRTELLPRLVDSPRTEPETPEEAA